MAAAWRAGTQTRRHGPRRATRCRRPTNWWTTSIPSWTLPTSFSSIRSRTGFSRAIPEGDAKNFHGINGDLDSVADFIRLYTTRSNRWTSPKFLAGESYGTTRAANLSGYLQQRMGYALNGVMLISAVLNFGTISFDRGQRPAVHSIPADLYSHRLVSQETAAGPDGQPEQGARGEPAVRLPRIHAGAAEGRRDLQRRTRRNRTETGAPDGSVRQVRRRKQSARADLPLHQRTAARRAPHRGPLRQPPGRHRPGSDQRRRRTTIPVMPACMRPSPPPGTSTCARS